jgi:hypothetical protein
VAARSKTWVYGRSLGVIAGSNPVGGMDVCLLRLLFVVHIEVRALRQSLVQRSLTEYGVSECDLETSIIRRPGLSKGCRVMRKHC